MTTTHDDQLETVAKMMRDTRIAVLTYVAPDLSDNDIVTL